MVEGNGGATEEGEEEVGEDQSIEAMLSRDSGDTLVIKERTDTSNKAYVPTSLDSEESVKSKPTKHAKGKKTNNNYEIIRIYSKKGNKTKQKNHKFNQTPDQIDAKKGR